MLDVGCDWNRAREQLLALPGIGPWTAEVIAMRGLGDPDAFPASDLGVRLAAAQLGLPADAGAGGGRGAGAEREAGSAQLTAERRAPSVTRGFAGAASGRVLLGSTIF